MTDIENERCTDCGRLYTDQPCGPAHTSIKDKISQRQGDKSWPPSTLETK